MFFNGTIFGYTRHLYILSNSYLITFEQVPFVFGDVLGYLNIIFIAAMFKREMTSEFDKTCKALVNKAVKSGAEKKHEQSFDDTLSSPTRLFMQSPSTVDNNNRNGSPLQRTPRDQEGVLDDSISDIVKINQLEKDMQKIGSKEVTSIVVNGVEHRDKPEFIKAELEVDWGETECDRLPSDVLTTLKVFFSNLHSYEQSHSLRLD